MTTIINAPAQQRPFGIVLHGGAGNIDPEVISPERQAAYIAVLTAARDSGYAVLERGGSAEDAVVKVITMLEDDLLFNAGRGSVLNHEGVVEMDASIMRGADLKAGAVACVHTIRNPILAARAVMERSPHVMLSGKGAEEFARARGLELEKNSYFITKERQESLERVREEEKTELDHDEYKEEGSVPGTLGNEKYGTVGAVALDKHGNLAAGTSTGGMTNKRHGRIGDSPIIGAGTYADNRSCAVSCTGHGEYFIRLAVAHEVSSLMLHRKWDIDKAASYVIHEELEKLGGDGGLISIDRRGNISMPFNTTGMFRAFRTSSGSQGAAIFKD